MKKGRSIIIIAVILVSALMGLFTVPKNGSAANPPAYFTISILAPNDDPLRNQWVMLMAEQLPKIGIGVDVLDHTGWAQISPRTWGYPGPGVIPTFAEGGYDLLFAEWYMGLDWNPSWLYDSENVALGGSNFLQYESHEMDWALKNYSNSYVFDDRIYWAEQIQAQLFEDLPEIPIVYQMDIYPHDENLEGWNELLWGQFEYQPMENWTIHSQTAFHYATPTDFEDFHIYKAVSKSDDMWLNQIYDGLLERIQNVDGIYSPRIATSYSSSDGLTYSFNLNPNACFADGHKLNASDIEYSYKMKVTPDYKDPGYNYWSTRIDNSSIHIINEYELEITLKSHTFNQESDFALPILPKHIWENVTLGSQWEEAENWAKEETSKLFGSGPYYLHEYDSINEIIHLKRNEHFDDWNEFVPNFDDIYFEYISQKEEALSQLTAGTIDMVDASFKAKPEELAKSTTFTFAPKYSYQTLAINNKNPYLGTGELCPISSPESAKHIRKAISHLIPREIIVEEILDGAGFPAVTSCPYGTIGFDDSLEPYEYSVIMLAKQHMDSAGYIFPCGGPPVPDNTGLLSTIAYVSTFGGLYVVSIILMAVLLIVQDVKRRRKLRKLSG